MKAVICRVFGDENNLELGEMPAPTLGPGQVRIAVKAAGLNFTDTVMLAGKYQSNVKPPYVPGFEIAGQVLEVAPGVTTCKPGDRVLAMLVRGGGFAEEVVTGAEVVVKIPDYMGWVEAGGFTIAWGTSYHSLTARAHLKAGENLLVLGAGGGVGLTAVAVGREIGANVIAAASSTEKLERARAQGADALINYKEENLREVLKDLTKGRGVDVIYDPVGGALFDTALRCIAQEGRIIVIGFASGEIQQIPANILLVKNCDVIGYTWATGDPWESNAASVRKALESLLEWYRQGKIKSHVSVTMPMADVKKGMRLMLDRKVIGKLVLTME
jgi:NADPH2:quinone reductase